MKKLFYLLKSDFRGSIFYYLRKIYIVLSMGLCTFLMVFLALFKKIKLGSYNRFFGIPVFYRYPQSKIIIGNNCTFRSDSTNLIGKNKKCILVTTSPTAYIAIGNNSGFNGAVIHCAEKIEIGNDVLAGFNVLIDDSDHHAMSPAERHTGQAETKAIVIEDNVWLGTNVTVLKGVRIGKNSVIGANSLVLVDVPENSIAIGNPCRVIKKI